MILYNYEVVMSIDGEQFTDELQAESFDDAVIKARNNWTDATILSVCLI